MKTYIIILMLTCLSALSFGQASKIMMEGISKNDMTLASENLSTWVILSINDKASTVRKSEAISQLSAYLDKIQPTGYQRRHSGNAVGDNQQYTVANVTAAEGKHRLFVYSEKASGLVKEIRLSSIQ